MADSLATITLQDQIEFQQREFLKSLYFDYLQLNRRQRVAASNGLQRGWNSLEEHTSAFSQTLKTWMGHLTGERMTPQFRSQIKKIIRDFLESIRATMEKPEVEVFAAQGYVVHRARLVKDNSIKISMRIPVWVNEHRNDHLYIVVPLNERQQND